MYLGNYFKYNEKHVQKESGKEEKKNKNNACLDTRKFVIPMSRFLLTQAPKYLRSTVP